MSEGGKRRGAPAAPPETEPATEERPGESDELYRLPLAEFTPARDALAKRLAAEGRRAAAAEVRRLRKPSVTAWAANQVVWHFPGEWSRLRDATASLRRAHETARSSEPLREATREQREALHACEARAAQLLEQHGHAAAPAVLSAISRTLQALADAPGVRPGRLEAELQPAGFDALAGLSLPPPAAAARGAERPVPAEPARAEVAARPADTPVSAGVRRQATEAARAEARTRRREEEREKRRLALAAAAEREARARAAAEAARSQAEDAEERLTALERELAAAREQSDEARRALVTAEREHSRATAEAGRLRAAADADD